MEPLFKKFVNAGVGFIAQGNKKVQATIDKLVQESKISEQEGKKILDELLKSGETKRAELEQQFQGLTERLKGRVGLGDEAQPAAKGEATAPRATSTVAKSANSVASKVAGAAKSAADKVSAAAESVQKSTAAKAAPAAKPAAKAAEKTAKAAPKTAKPAAKTAAKKAAAAPAPAADGE